MCVCVYVCMFVCVVCVRKREMAWRTPLCTVHSPLAFGSTVGWSASASLSSPVQSQSNPTREERSNTRHSRRAHDMTGGAAGHGDAHFAGPGHVVPARAHGGEGACARPPPLTPPVAVGLWGESSTPEPYDKAHQESERATSPS